MSEPYIGEIRMVGFNFAPENWALCDGSLLAISQNETLFNLIGTTYGGDGQTTSPCRICSDVFRCMWEPFRAWHSPSAWQEGPRR